MIGFLLGIAFTIFFAFIGGLLRNSPNNLYCSKCGRILLEHDNYRYAIDVTLREAHESYEDFINRAKENNLGKWVKK